jgi:hypothetical protein
MKKLILAIVFALYALVSFAQPGSLNQGAYRSRVVDSTTVVFPAGYGVLYYSVDQAKWRICDPGGTNCRDIGSGSGGGTTYIFSSPLSESAGTVSIANAAADGSTKGAASFVANDFNATSGNIAIDYTNGQKATTSTIGFLTDTDWDTFNNKRNTSFNALNDRSKTGDFTISLADSSAVNFLEAVAPLEITIPNLSGAGITKVLNFVFQRLQSDTVTIDINGQSVSATNGVDMTGTTPQFSYLVIEYRGSDDTWVIHNGWPDTGGGGGAGLVDGDYGDITVGGTGTTMTIDNLAVTNAKINDVAYSKITSVPDGVADGTTKGVLGLTAADFNTSSGIASIDYANGQAATSGQDGLLQSADWTTFNNKAPTSAPTFTTSITGPYTTNGGILYTNGSGLFAQTGAGTSTTVLHGGTSPAYSAVALGADVSGDLPFANLTQIAGLSVLGVTGTSTADVAAITGTAGQVLQVNAGGTAAAFVTPAGGSALSLTNDTNVTLTSSGSLSTAVLATSGIIAGWTGTLAVARGGTGADNTTQTYTPTLTNTTNVAASTARQCTYLRVGNAVTVSGQLDIDPTATGQIVLGISLPIASALTTAFQAGGTAAPTTVADAPAAIISDATNDRATLTYVCVDVTNHTMAFTFTYQIL